MAALVFVLAALIGLAGLCVIFVLILADEHEEGKDDFNPRK